MEESILILVSFTGVVGYQTTKSSTIGKASPLFAVRSSRAIDEESVDLSCDYVGKGEEIAISVPTYNSRNTQLQKVIDVISRMDDKSFDMLVDLIIRHLQQKDGFQEYSEEEILQSLNQLKNKQSKILRPPTLFTCWFDEPLICFIALVSWIITVIISLPIYFVACFILTTDSTFK